MFDRQTFLHPIAHRGLHDQRRGIIENTWPAFRAALDRDIGIECDVQATKDNVPVVFHDFTVDRLLNGKGPLARFTYDEVQTLAYTDTGQDTCRVLKLETLLARVDGRVPVLLELKSDWSAPNRAWLDQISGIARSYSGPIALMSFDPAVLLYVKDRAPPVPRGLVSGLYRAHSREPWWPDKIDPARAAALSDLASIDTVMPDFIAYHVKDLDHAPLQRIRRVQNLPVFTWTVRSAADWNACNACADAAIFEGQLPKR